MKKREQMSIPATGGSSLLVIFAVLCLTVFALLSLNTVLAEKRISEASAQQVQDWYRADLQAQEIFAGLRRGETLPGVTQTGTQYAYTVPISRHRRLEVRVKEENGSWEVLSWQTVAQPEEVQETLPVWQGEDGSEWRN